MTYVNSHDTAFREALRGVLTIKALEEVATGLGEYDDPIAFVQNVLISLMSSNIEYSGL